MRRGLLVFLWFVVVVFGYAQLYAQLPEGGAYGLPSPVTQPPSGQIDLGEDGKPIDKEKTEEEKPAKVRKPLESYFFDDSVRAQRNFVWNLNMYTNHLDIKSIDSILNVFQVDYPFMRKDVGSAYLGNLGGASVPLNYVTRPQYRDFEFASSYDAYLFNPERANFYNVKHPFTQLSYYSAGQKRYAEESILITHAQNISPSTGFNLEYNSRGTQGIYAWQKARDKNLSLGFNHTGKKYTAHAGYIHNKADLRENGGITDDGFITDTIMELPENIPVNLNDATNMLRSNTFYVVQSYGIPLRKLKEDDYSIAGSSTLFFGLSTQYSRFNKVYADTKENSGDFYDNWYINSISTNDSIAETLLSNRVFIQIQPWNRESVIGLIDAGAGMDNHSYSQFHLDQYLQGAEKEKRDAYYVYGSLQGKLMRYADWGANLRFHPAGYRSGDVEFGANLSLHAYSKKRPMTLSGSFRSSLRSPGYWAENYFSNHYVWSNSFDKESETRFDISFKIPHLALELGGNQSLMTDKIYYDAAGVPAQSGGNVGVTGLYASKNFRIGGFCLDNRVLLQWSTDQQVVPVPMMSLFMTYYYDFDIVKNVLHMQIGVNGWYNTRYYAVGYIPATAQFYNQREKELGNYLMMDAFVSAKWKRMRILLKYQHVNENLFGERNYFTVLHYPLNERVLKLGVSWGFYD